MSEPGPEAWARPDAVARRIEEEGFAVLEGVIEEGLVRELARAVDRAMVSFEVAFGPNEFLGLQTRRLFNLLARDPVFERVPVHPVVLGAVEEVLDSECLLSSLTAIDMHPGETPQPIHADDGSYPVPKPHPAFHCTAIWALTDFDRANGGTRIVPASHRFDRSPRREDRGHESIGVEMGAGSVLLYHGSLWHGGGANTSDRRRVGIVANYCAGFMRQEECQLLALERDRVAAFDPRLRRLVGYGTYGGLLGHVEGRDPESFVDSEAGSPMVWGRIRS